MLHAEQSLYVKSFDFCDASFVKTNSLFSCSLHKHVCLSRDVSVTTQKGWRPKTASKCMIQDSGISAKT